MCVCVKKGKGKDAHLNTMHSEDPPLYICRTQFLKSLTLTFVLRATHCCRAQSEGGAASLFELKDMEEKAPPVGIRLVAAVLSLLNKLQTLNKSNNMMDCFYPGSMRPPSLTGV